MVGCVAANVGGLKVPDGGAASCWWARGFSMMAVRRVEASPSSAGFHPQPGHTGDRAGSKTREQAGQTTGGMVNEH